jgi:hypothetical protein
LQFRAAATAQLMHAGRTQAPAVLREVLAMNVDAKYLRNVLVTFVTVAIKASEPDVVFFRTPSFRNWYDVVEFDFIVSKCPSRKLLNHMNHL